MMSMQPIDAIPLPPHATVRLEPMGMHAMVSGLKRPLKVGQSFPLTVRFRGAGVQTVRVQVRSLGGAPAAKPSMPGMPGM
jgi:copper(I)-binding protein